MLNLSSCSVLIRIVSWMNQRKFLVLVFFLLNFPLIPFMKIEIIATHLCCTIENLALHSNHKLNAQHQIWSKNTWNSLHELVTIAHIISFRELFFFLAFHFGFSCVLCVLLFFPVLIFLSSIISRVPYLVLWLCLWLKYAQCARLLEHWFLLLV